MVAFFLPSRFTASSSAQAELYFLGFPATLVIPFQIPFALFREA